LLKKRFNNPQVKIYIKNCVINEDKMLFSIKTNRPPNRPLRIKNPCKYFIYKGLNFIFAVRTGLEPATSCVTGRHSNQLNYRTNIFMNNSVYFSDLPDEKSGYSNQLNYRTNFNERFINGLQK
jgi:hypothetical protein